MRLNKKGFGLKEMIIISSVLFIFLLIVAYYIFALYNRLDTVSASQYLKMESMIKTAAIRYDTAVSKKSVITLDDLKDAELLDLFTDSNDKPCDGYVEVDDGDFKAYIKCEYYTTKGYKK